MQSQSQYHHAWQLSLVLDVHLLGEHTHNARYLFVSSPDFVGRRLKLVGHVVVDTCQEVHDLCVAMTLK